MKKLIATVLSAILIISSATAQHIKDENLQQYIKKHWPTAIDKNGDLTDIASYLISELDLDDWDIKDLSGIEGLKNIEEIHLAFNYNLKAIPFCPPKLRILDITDDPISELPILSNSMQIIWVGKTHYFECLPNKVEKLRVLLDDSPDHHNNLKGLGSLHTVYSHGKLPQIDIPICSDHKLTGTIHIPDMAFAKAIRENCKDCIDENNNLLPAAGDVRDLNIIHIPEYAIEDLSGIEGFTSLIELHLDYESGSKIKCYPASLKNVIIYRNVFRTDFNLPACTNYTLTKAVHILDPGFAKALREKCDNCIDKNNNLLPAAAQTYKLDVSGYGIRNLAGLEAFRSLSELNISGNPIHKLPQLPSTLTSLTCSADSLMSIEHLPDSLRSLTCRRNLLKVLPELPIHLERLQSGECSLTSLPVLPASLITLGLSNNQLTALPELPPKMTDLDVAFNKISAFPEFPNTITYMNICDNPFTELPKLPKALIDLYCSDAVKCLPLQDGIESYNIKVYNEQSVKRFVEDCKYATSNVTTTTPPEEPKKKEYNPNEKKHYIYVVYSSYQNGNHNELTGEWYRDLDIYIYPITASGKYSFAQVKEKLSYLEERNKHGGDRYDTQEEGEWLEGEFDKNSIYKKRDPGVKNVYVKKEIILEYHEE